MKLNRSSRTNVQSQVCLSVVALCALCLAFSPVAAQAQTYTPNDIYTIVGGGTPPTTPLTASLPGASAAIEGVLCALAFRNGLIPPTLNYRTPDPDCNLDVVANEPREGDLRYILSNAFGFGGINSCIIYKKI